MGQDGSVTNHEQMEIQIPNQNLLNIATSLFDEFFNSQFNKLKS